MKLLTKDELFGLQHGDKVTKIYHGQSRGLRFVGVMPSSENTLIFSDGTHLESLYISPKDGSFSGDWYGGEYDSYVIGKKKIEWHEQQIRSIQHIYIDKYLSE